MLGGEGGREDLIFPRVGRLSFGRGPPGFKLLFGGRGFDTRGSLLLIFSSSPFRVSCGFVLRFLMPGRLPGGGHYRLLTSVRDQLWKGIWMWVNGCSRGGLDDTPSSDDVVPPFAQVHLLGRGTGLLGFRSSRLACRDTLSAALGRLICKIRLRLLPLYTATTFRCVVSPSHRNEAVPAGYSIHRGGGIPHKRCTGFLIRSYSACDRSAGIAYIAADLLVPRTTPPTIASRRFR